jgi:hypothetical protein
VAYQGIAYQKQACSDLETTSSNTNKAHLYLLFLFYKTSQNEESLAPRLIKIIDVLARHERDFIMLSEDQSEYGTRSYSPEP